MVMPVMDGPTLIRLLKILNPKVRIIANSGFATSEQYTELGKYELTHFLNKPYPSSTLLRAVREALKAPEPAVA